jgi:hypothetical protein
MREDLYVIPEAGEERSPGGVLARIYHDIGLAAVAEALKLSSVGFEPEMVRSLERGEFYLLPAAQNLAPAGADA